ncbi:hypothetical protein HZU75_16450 [Chitinibacter fontanus]|uniref:Uncharacterized protein n=1 Tax=Chitinibacter fontanus TaxID=1737446 RepID=A0A7D5Z9K5_9NEIS|nr:hypothetical protein [Chitinibacter fontanus]QLI82983.1 hypothetical protein HZU75_16450 [Chitinibacter fontanus]
MRAIELANELESYTFGPNAAIELRKEIALELRKLVTENQRLSNLCKHCTELKSEALMLVHDFDPSLAGECDCKR